MSDFKQQLEKVSEFFKPENLAQQTLKYEGEVALLVIDVQKEFCDPNGRRGNVETEEVSTRIQSLVPEFRKAGIPVYAIYFSYKKKEAAEIDFYKFTPDNDDVLVAKNKDSAFVGSDIKKILQKDGRKLLLTCGFNLSACVSETVLDARWQGFDVCLLSDLAGNDRYNTSAASEALERMREKGVVIEQSADVLEQLRVRKNAPPTP